MEAAEKQHSTVSLIRSLIRGCLLGLILILSLHIGYVLAGSNFRTVVPGKVYRCAQPSESRLRRMIETYGIKTIVNLRGCCPNLSWYQKESITTADLTISQEDLNFSAMRLPSRKTLLDLIQVFQRCEYPILLHCHQGADRTGLASVLFLLLQTDASLETALANLGPATGHLPLGKTRHMDHFFILYRTWLSNRGVPHNSDRLVDWIEHHYCAESARAEYRLLDSSENMVLTCKRFQPQTARLRCRNQSNAAWRFHPGTTAGIHGQVGVIDNQGQFLFLRRVGMFHACVNPGGEIDLKLPIPSLKPGRYQLLFDLIDEQRGTFSQMGNDPFVVELEVL